MNTSNSTAPNLSPADDQIYLWLNHVGAAGCVLLTAGIGALVPLLMGVCCSKQANVHNLFISLGSCFGGGIFIAAGFVHLLPDAIEELGDMDFPWAECACALGLLGTMILDRAKEVCFVFILFCSVFSLN